MSDSLIRYAPGWPGIPPRWTSSAKTGIGTALNQHSKVWFTLSHGILNEVYFPRVDQACTRDLGLIVTNGRDFFSEEKRHCSFENRPLEPGIPVYQLTNSCNGGRYRIHKEVLTDSYRNVVLQKIRFEPLQGPLLDYHLYALLAPHLANWGSGNTGWIGDYKGFPMFFAERDGVTLALASSVPWKKMSVGFVGTSDGWQDLSEHFQMEGNTPAPKMATLRSRVRLILPLRMANSSSPWASVPGHRRPGSTHVRPCSRTTTKFASITSLSGATGRTSC